MCRTVEVDSLRRGYGIPEKTQFSPRSRASLSDAMQAWFSGEFERCLELCDAIVARDSLTVTQIRLLRSRALLRLGRVAEALRELQDRSSFHASPDAIVTALILTATAQIRLGDYTLGLETLAEARSVPGDVHPTIRCEIALTAGLGLYGMRSLEEAQRQLELVTPDADIVYARALEYRGWVESVRANYDAAGGFFAAALTQLDTCRHYDRYLEGNALMALAILAAERLDLRAWERVEARAAAFDWSAQGLAGPHYYVSNCASVMKECSGDVRGAMRSALEAEMCSVGDAYKAASCLRRAEIARGSGDTVSQIAYVDQAELMLARVRKDELKGDELYVALTMAEEFALFGDRERARHFLAFYRSSERPSGMLAGSSDVRREGFERMAEAYVFSAEGDEASALRSFLDAFEIFERIGYVRRATVAALALAKLTRSDRYTAYASAATAPLSAAFWMRREAESAAASSAPPLQRLTPLETQTLVLICEGRTNREIAASQGRSYYTVRNMVSDLLDRFAVDNRKRLIAACRGLGIAAAPGRVTD